MPALCNQPVIRPSGPGISVQKGLCCWVVTGRTSRWSASTPALRRILQKVYRPRFIGHIKRTILKPPVARQGVVLPGLKVEGRGLHRLLLVPGELGHTGGEGVGDTEVHWEISGRLKSAPSSWVRHRLCGFRVGTCYWIRGPVGFPGVPGRPDNQERGSSSRIGCLSPFPLSGLVSKLLCRQWLR